MKRSKFLLLTMLCVCVLASASPARGVETSDSSEEAKLCQSLGILKGDGQTEFKDYLKKTPNRMQAATMYLRLLGLEETATNFHRPDNFTDAALVPDPEGQAILAYLKAHPSLGFQGYPDGSFGATESVTAQQFYKILLVSLGYQQGTDFTWQEVATFAADKGLTKFPGSTTDFTTNYLCVATVEALHAKEKDSQQTLLSQLIAQQVIPVDKAKENGLLPKEYGTHEGHDRSDPAPQDGQTTHSPNISFLSYTNKTVSLELSCANPDARIYFTYALQESPEEPTERAASVPQEGKIEIADIESGKELILKAVAIAPGLNHSAVTTFRIGGYCILALAPSDQISLDSDQLLLQEGTLTVSTLLSLLEVSSGATVAVYPDTDSDCVGLPLSGDQIVQSGYHVVVTYGLASTIRGIYLIEGKG